MGFFDFLVILDIILFMAFFLVVAYAFLTRKDRP